MKGQDAEARLLNFTCFSGPVQAVRATLQSIGANKAIINPSSIMKKEVQSREECAGGGNNEMERELGLSPSQLFNGSGNLARGCTESRSVVVANGERANNEPAAAVASSVCSGNNMEIKACDPKHNLKRKRRRSEDDDDDLEYYLSEDYEEETESTTSTATTALIGGSGCRRSRGPKVHSSSEKRRRESINERMRTLQELIPNCNKVDKVSMLDEAIEYLKTLQFQLQMMMYMGRSRVCVPPRPLMFPAAMQLMQQTQMPCFSTMAPGMNNVFGAHLPGSPISGASSNHQQMMMAGCNSSMLGAHGQQRLPILMPHIGSVSYSTTYPNMQANASRPAGGLVGDVDCARTAPPSCQK